MTHAINDPKGELVGIMLIARNLEYLSQVQSTVRYSRKLAALGRLSAGVAHEVKNPLNAMMIHLELLRQQFAPRRRRRARRAGRRAAPRRVAEAPPVDRAEALQHVDVIASEIRRLDEVVQGFLKFTRPEDLKLQPVALAALFDEVVPIVRPEAERAGVAARRRVRRRARRERRSGDAAAGVPEPGAERLSGDAERRHAAHPRASRRAAAACRSRSPTPASASSPSTCSGSSICISRRRRRAAASACRWSTGRCRCTTARSRYSRRQGRARRSACCCRRRERRADMHQHAAFGESPACSLPSRCAGAARRRAARTRSAKTRCPDAAARRAGAAAARRRADRAEALPPPVPLVAEPARNTPRAAAAAPRDRAATSRRKPSRPSREPPEAEPPAEAAEAGRRAAEPPTDAADDAGRQRKARSSARFARRSTRATADLNRVDYRALNADARTQYDTAKRFIRQAEDAVRAKNLVFAKNLADKAAALAAQLAGT